MKKVFIACASYEYVRFFAANGYAVVSDINQADFVCFTGGSDVSPHLYNEHKHPSAHCDMQRDVVEKNFFNFAKQHKLPMVGICRGGQFLNVMSGGKMYQHVSNHTRYHYLADVETGERIFCSSTHHQMMRPGEDAIIIATAKEYGWREHMSPADEEKAIIIRENSLTLTDIEVVYYPKTEALCFQPHPEFSDESLLDLQKYFFSLVEKHLKMERKV